MNDKKLIKKIQHDFKQSNPTIINNNDNESSIKKKLNLKYSEDISDSDYDSDLTSYKNRNIKIVNQLSNDNFKNKLNKSTLINDTEIVDNTKNNKNIKKNNNDIDEINNNIEVDDNSEEEEEEEQEYEYSLELENKVKEFVKNDDRIRELQNELKLLNNSKKIAENEILKHLERLGENNINITGGKLIVNQYGSKEGLKEDIIKEALSEKIKDPKIIEFIFEKIKEKRIAGGKIQVSLKRTFERGEKKNKKN